MMIGRRHLPGLNGDQMPAPAPSQPDPANAESAGEAAYRRLRADIIQGHLRPAQRLVLEGLRDAYGAGISTLREVLNRLCSEGLVLAEGQRGFQVAPVSAQDLEEVAGLRLLLEHHAMAQSFAAGDLDWEAQVVAAHHKLSVMERRMVAGQAPDQAPDQSRDTALWKRYDQDFHFALIAACGSTALRETHAAVYDKYLRYQIVALTFRGSVSGTEHRTLLEAALARDIAAAQRILEGHVLGCVTDTLAGGALAPFTGGTRRG